MAPSKLITSRELAATLSIHIKSVYRLCKDGVITPIVLPSGEFRFCLIATLDELMVNTETPSYLIDRIIETWREQ